MIGSAVDVVFVLALVVMAGCSLYFTPRIQVARVPMQWGFDGAPTWYAPRVVGLWGPLAFIVAVRVFIAAAAYFTPDKVHHVEIGIVGLSVVMAAVHAWHLWAVTRWVAKQP